jgi:hypothetical protein
MIGATLSLALALAGCAVAARGGAGQPPCVKLARTFYLIAAYRDGGATRDDQVEIARAAGRKSGSEAMLRTWLRAIDLVYRFDDAPPDEVAFTVMDHCVVDGEGRASVRTLWPAR